MSSPHTEVEGQASEELRRSLLKRYMRRMEPWFDAEQYEAVNAIARDRVAEDLDLILPAIRAAVEQEIREPLRAATSAMAAISAATGRARLMQENPGTEMSGETVRVDLTRDDYDRLGGIAGELEHLPAEFRRHFDQDGRDARYLRILQERILAALEDQGEGRVEQLEAALKSTCDAAETFLAAPYPGSIEEEQLEVAVDRARAALTQEAPDEQG